MKNTRICIAALALALLVSLAGCGTEAPAATPAQTAPEPTSGPAETAGPVETARPAETPAPTEEPEPEDKTIRVSTAREFLQAIAPGAVIELAPGDYNLTEYLDTVRGDISDYVARGSTPDGWQAEIREVEGLTIRGAEGGTVEVVVEPRYSDVLCFSHCSDLSIGNITFGHTIEKGNCEGAVLSFTSCRDVRLDGLDLYGCGTYGVTADHTDGVALTDCVIRDCSYGIIDVYRCSGLVCTDCTFQNNGGYDMLSIYDAFALFDGCAFTGNEGTDFLPAYYYGGSESGARFESCSFGLWESRRLSEELEGRGCFVIGADCRFKVEPGKRTVYAESVEQMIENIAPNTQILLAPGKYNLSDTLSELFAREGGRFNDSREFVRIEQQYDGPELVVTGVRGLTIASASGSAADTEIVTDPRYADVLRFEDCSEIGVMNLTMGHTDAGECAGDVLRFSRCADIVLYGLDLYGCGVYGIGTDECGRLVCFDSTIRDCSYGALDLTAAQARQMFLNCVLTGSGGGGFFYADEASAGEFCFYRCSFGERESNSFAAYAYNDLIAAEDCSWSEITEYPEYSGEWEEEYEWIALDTARLKLVSFDTQVLTDEYYYICYETVDKQSGEVCFETDDDVRFLVFEEDGSGCFWLDDETGRRFRYAMDSSYSCILTFDDGAEAGFSLYADQGGALPDSPGGKLWLALSLEGETIWFY